MALVDIECGVWVNDEEFNFNVCKSMKQPMYLLVIYVIDGEMMNIIDVDLVNDPLVGVL